MSDLIDRRAAIEAITDELDRIDHVPQWVFDRLEGRLKQLPPAQLGTNLAEVGTDTISRQQAIDEIDEWIKAFRENGHKESAADACLIQDGIIHLPPAQPEPCEDAVSRKDCLQALSHLMDVEGFRSGWAVSRANVECMLKAMPSVTPKQRTGKWIDGIIPNDSDGLPVIVCDQCNTFFPLQFGDGHNFCPNCGWAMKGTNDANTKI